MGHTVMKRQHSSVVEEKRDTAIATDNLECVWWSNVAIYPLHSHLIFDYVFIYI